jgi:hypothetical protein
MRNLAPRRTGKLAAGIGIHSMNTAGGFSRHQIVDKDDVLVGYLGELSGGAVDNARDQLGAWIESGTKRHTIPGPVAINGRMFVNVDHPGQRAQRVAARAIRSAEWEVLADVADKLNQVFPGGDSVG